MPEKEIKKAVLVMSTTVAFGTFSAYGVSALLAVWGIYKYSFLTGTVALGITGIVWLFVFGKVNNPIKTVTDEENVPIVVTEKKKQKLGASVWSVIILLAVFAVVNNLVKDGLTTWVPRILKVNYGLSDSLSILLTLVLPVIAIFGATLAVTLNKKIKNYIIICGILFLLSTAFTVAVKLLLGTDIWALVLICFAAISMLMASVNNVITSMAPLYMRDKINPGLLTGVLDGFCYLGSTISMYGLGALADSGGWGAVFTLLLALVATCFLIAAVYAVIGKIREKKKPKFTE